MKRRHFNLSLGAAAAAPTLLARAAASADYALVADVAEACSCAIPCPCNFGLPTEQKCEGSRLLQLTAGHVGDAPLAGIAFVVTFEMGQWTRIYVDEALDTAQRAAFEAVFPLAFAGFRKLMLEREFVPLNVTRGVDGVRFEVPESSVEIKPMRGLDGAPIRISGLPSPAFHDYVQHESVMHRHASATASWSHTGTNGFTSRMLVSGQA